ncbi:hypothetical protein [Actinomadura sp. 6K520]|uniref:hypothetical protein n=1 Tax=Actinomadura sp. 6K520 TaxID=2530364 RepID=UPI001047F9BB|nr:hypothetical protein [Actinomadura sp. 6K520]TDE36428.1 hypothetical protein E1289_06000 [Actinomadura sp. 6K520]
MTDEESDSRSFWARHRKVIIGTAITSLVAPITVGVISTQLNEGAKKVSEKIGAGPPVQARVVSIGRSSGRQGDDWVFPVGHRVERPLLNGASDAKRMRAAGAVDPVVVMPVLILQGQWKEGVTVTGIQVVPKCGRPLSGTLVYKPPGAGPMKNPRMVFDLDEPQPRARVPKRDGSPGADYFQQTSISLRKDEQTVVVAEMRTREHYCTFDIFVEASTGGETTKTKVETGGNRLAVTAYVDGALTSSSVRGFASYRDLYVFENGAFVQKNPDGYSAGAQ